MVKTLIGSLGTCQYTYLVKIVAKGPTKLVTNIKTLVSKRDIRSNAWCSRVDGFRIAKDITNEGGNLTSYIIYSMSARKAQLPGSVKVGSWYKVWIIVLLSA